MQPPSVVDPGLENAAVAATPAGPEAAELSAAGVTYRELPGPADRTEHPVADASTVLPVQREMASSPSGVPPMFGRLRWRVGSAALLIILALLASGVLVLLLPTMGQQLAPQGVDVGPSVKVKVPGTGESGKPSGEPSGEATVPAATNTDAGRTGGAAVLVHVAGAVAHPGIVELPSGSRVYEAIEAAGGELPDAAVEAVNLAAVLADGERIIVPTRDQAAEAPAAGASAGTSSGVNPAGAKPSAVKVNLNSAAVQELMTLPKVGPVLAQRIVDFRQQHGKFASTQELDAVDGIGPKLLAALLPLVTV
ncbi:helix-hairpin-helix domain-containing protein [Arthrobacter sp. A5]|uniref:helix-hairpin-helix domain-containing protein n=1 Tax=Arthrobacter sp. A5 TaxID=576926 RepID=UPI003DA849DC